MKIKLEIDVPVGRKCTGGCNHIKYIGGGAYCGAFDDGQGNLFHVNGGNKHRLCVQACDIEISRLKNLAEAT